MVPHHAGWRGITRERFSAIARVIQLHIHHTKYYL
jgi:hypothetical protein